MKYEIVCGCSDPSLEELVEGKRTTDHFLWEIIIRKAGYSNSMLGHLVVEIKEFEELSKESKDIIQWCLDFLAYHRDYAYENVDEYGNRCDYKYSNKYITLWSFIYDFLKIEKDGGIDYLLMNALGWYDFTEHGGGIRCSWIKCDKKHIKCPEERKKIIEDWIDSMPFTR